MHVLNLCCTFNRVHCLKRSIRCFLDQDYEGQQTLFIYNSGKPIDLENIVLPSKKKIIVVNNDIDTKTGLPYNNVGAKYRDALTMASKADVVTSWDDDDIFLPWFNRKGVEGLTKAKEQGKLAYKTLYSWYRHIGGIEKMNNVFEPAIFVDYEHIKENGYQEANVLYHNGWLLPLVEQDKILVDTEQEPLFIYDWHPELKVFKLSGGRDTPERFYAHQQMSNSILEDNVKLSPEPDNSKYYNLINVSS